MKTALAAVTSGALTPPPPGTGKSGTCPTTRDFRIVDMDQSDNVDTQYLLINNHVLAQATPANTANNTKAQVLSNGSDNALVDDFLDPNLGCTPWMVTSSTASTGMSPGLSLNELVANQFQQNPALIPENDPMAVVTDNNGNPQPSLQKLNLYRAGVGQPAANSLADAAGTTYCVNFAASGLFIAQNQALFQNGPSPAPATATNLFTFMAQRFAASFGPVPALGCQTIFGLQTNPVNLTMNGDCVVTAATINTAVLQMIVNGQIKPGATVASSSATAKSTAAAASSAASASTSATQMHRGGAGGSASSTAAGGAAASASAGSAATTVASSAGNSAAAATTTTAATSSAGKNGGQSTPFPTSASGGRFGGAKVRRYFYA